MSLRQRVTFTQYRGHALVTAPASEPVTADELRAHLRETVDGLPYDQADALIAEARELIEERTGLAMINQTHRMALDYWPVGREQWWDGVRDGAISDMGAANGIRAVTLPRYPMSSITSVVVYDEASNATSVVVADTFDIDTYSKPGRMVLQSGATWPIALRGSNAIEITYVAGFGATSASVPAILRRAVKQVAAYLYSHAGDDCTSDDALGAAASLLSAYKVRPV